MRLPSSSLVGLALSGLLAAPLGAQSTMDAPAPRAFVEARVGAAVPTFDIADVADVGLDLGATIGYQLAPSWVVMGEFDYGMHKDEPTGDIDIKTMHFIGKVGYSLTGPRERGLEAVINLGAGIVRFDVEGAGDVFTYPAINAGAKIAYNVNPSFAIVLSPQGDIAFADEAEVGTSNAWVWPVTAGVRVKF
ncbi:MAG: outer membrane beta-barrel protein [Gemmatimonadota bacterium]